MIEVKVTDERLNAPELELLSLIHILLQTEDTTELLALKIVANCLWDTEKEQYLESEEALMYLATASEFTIDELFTATSDQMEKIVEDLINAGENNS